MLKMHIQISTRKCLDSNHQELHSWKLQHNFLLKSSDHTDEPPVGYFILISDSCSDANAKVDKSALWAEFDTCL